MNQASLRDYTDKTVYVGIDIHKKTYCCVSVCEHNIVKRDTLPACPEGLVKYIRDFFPGAHVKRAYEAGFSGFYLHRYLLKNDMRLIILLFILHRLKFHHVIAPVPGSVRKTDIRV
jgi:transposase